MMGDPLRRASRRAALGVALAAVVSAACGRPPVQTVTVPMRVDPMRPMAAADDPSSVDLSITFDPRVTGNVGWVKLPKPLTLEMIGNPGAAMLDVTTERMPFAPGDPMRQAWLRTLLSRAPLEGTAIEIDVETLCSPALLDAIGKARPRRLLLAIGGGITPRAVGCLRALPTERLYLTGCLHRAHRHDTCDGDAELGALAADETMRARVRGLAVSLSDREAVQRLGRLEHLEYLAISPGPGARDGALFDALPFDALPHVRYLEAAAENRDGLALAPDARRFLGRLYTLRWNGHAAGPIPVPCNLERVSFDVLTAADVDALAPCTQLRELSSDDARFDAAEPVVAFTLLERLHLRHWKAENLSPLARMGALRSLSLPAGAAREHAFVATMEQLRSVDFSQTALHDLGWFRELAALEELDVDFTEVSDLAPLFSLTHLVALSLHETKVTDLSVVAHLTALKELTFSGTRVTDLTPLESHPSLERVTLYESAVTDVGALLTLPKLTRANIQRLRLPQDQVEKLRQRLHGELIQ